MNEVTAGVENIQTVFDNFPSKYLLMNGNIEKNLKFFVGMVLEGSVDGFSYAMDKKIDNHEVDMLGFINGESVLAIEFKCTFSSDPGATIKAAKDACKKIIKTNEIALLANSKKQIVHFLNHSFPASDTSLNPEYIKRKYPTGNRLSPEELASTFKSELGEKYFQHRIHSYQFPSDAIGLDALIVDIT
ncbi:hypothetical protein PVT68_08945 [Microbulbifer bruguierae]|uniref:Restriction endonuclease type IV Mrr domain-containing protein n=1 Tax=Microbulbifer bruguierae TaxID=3029061 RepID=A0ABY8NIZ6_9GAMM|nr:hypothetical protein [Microbulbifer bruguierae]WGL18409.1 hypothetical protein PVT68_08945 [Microbulbifer bruguierae]